MKTSIRSKKFTMGILLFLAIILFLSVSSAVFLYRLSMKTSAILKENHYSVVYARDLSENLTIINQEITNCILINNSPDTALIKKELNSFEALGVVSVLVMGSAFFNTQPLSEGMPT